MDILLLPRGRGREMVRVLVVDNNAEFLEVFVRLLEHQPDMEVVAQAASMVRRVYTFRACANRRATFRT
jgi:CheY-like chemotaxis protein